MGPREPPTWRQALTKAGPIGGVCVALLLGGGYAGKRMLDAHLRLVDGMVEKMELLGLAIDRVATDNTTGRAAAVGAVSAVCERCCQGKRR